MRALIVAAMVCWCGLAFASGQPPQPSGQQSGPHAQQPQATEQPAEPDTRGSKESPLVVKVQKSQHEATDEENERGERTSTDLWTIRIGIATVLILIVQAIVFGWQGWQLRRTVGEMESATRATLAVAESLQRSVRALVLIEPVEMIGWPKSEIASTECKMADIKIDFKLKNDGFTPAFLTGRYYKFFLLPRTEKLPDVPEYGEEESLDSIPLGTIGERWQYAPIETLIKESERLAVEAGKANLLLYGFVRYDDAFGNKCETRFCTAWLANVEEPHFVYYGPPAYHQYTYCPRE